MLTREEWLLLSVEKLSNRVFNKPNRRLPSKLAVSCGIPTGSARAIGQCWSHTASEDATTQIFICPSLADPFEVLAVLVHELCHAVVGVKEGHNRVFGTLARSVGLQGKLTSTIVTADSELGSILEEILTDLPTYPHKPLKKTKKKEKSKVKKRVKVVSECNPEYTFSMVKEMIETYGLPLDPWGKVMQVKSDKREKDA